MRTLDAGTDAGRDARRTPCCQEGTGPAAPSSAPMVLGDHGKVALADDRTTAVTNLSAVGRMFFVDPRDNRQHCCSGSLLQSNNAKMLLTAGHCTTDAGVLGRRTSRPTDSVRRRIRRRGYRRAHLTGRWRTLHHITASPSKIGDIIKAALVLTHFEHGRLT
jgi:hypothetical protein